MKKISIIVPVYNVEGYLVGCLESLVRQTYTDLEIILVNDGSTDGSAKICERYAQQDRRVTVIHKENGGLSSARNAGLEQAHGTYVLFVDGDDYLAQNAVEILLRTAEESKADLVQFTYLETQEEYKSVLAPQPQDVLIKQDTESILNMLYQMGGVGASACTKLYRRSLFDALRFKEGIIHEDEHLATFMLQKVASVAYINSVLYYYVVRGASIIQSAFSKAKLDFFFVSEARMHELKKLHFTTLLEREKARFFITGIDIWCKAKKAKDGQAMQVAEEKIKSILREKLVLTRKFRFIFRLLKIHFSTLNLYYAYRVIQKQI